MYMRKIFFATVLFLSVIQVIGQKKSLTHQVYDGWQSAGERAISQDGQFVAYTINPQEGDGQLYVKRISGEEIQVVPRGYQLKFSDDSKFIFFKIKPLFKDTRDARIKKKKLEEMPKDSLGWIDLSSKTLTKIARVKTFKMPEKADAMMVAYHLDKSLPVVTSSVKPDSITQLNRLSKLADSLQRVADSLKNLALEAQTKGLGILQPLKKEGKNNSKPEELGEDGTDLVLWVPGSKQQRIFKYVSEYYFNENGQVLLMEISRKSSDPTAASQLVWYHTGSGKSDTIFKKFNDAKNYALDRVGTQLAFVAERDSSVKALTKFYKLFYYKVGNDSATLVGDKSFAWLNAKETISPDYMNFFSKDGRKLFFGVAPIRKPKDTTLVDFETARLDVWHYQDDFLQPQQLLQVSQELKRSALAVYYPKENKTVRVADMGLDQVIVGDEGNADHVLAISSKGERVATQWNGFALQKAFLISTIDGSQTPVNGHARASYLYAPQGKFVAWYDWKLRSYFAYDIATKKTNALYATGNGNKNNHPLWDEEDDHPDDPPPYGVMGWEEGDQSLLVYDRYDIIRLDPKGLAKPFNITSGKGRATGTELRYVPLDPEEKSIRVGQSLLLKAFHISDKKAGFYTLKYQDTYSLEALSITANAYPSILKAKNAAAYLVQRSTINESELFTSSNLKDYQQITQIADQQKSYNWLSVELMKWTMFDGKQSEGLLFKPENFDPKKKYPVIFYFYERNTDGLYNYRAPAPSASTVNIPYFVSNGYLVFDPNIYYKNGEPGESAYNSVVSAAKHLAKLPFVDASKMAIQGQSWGGYQVAYLVTRTNMFAAAGAGAPVANMTSAYGGIRWGSGLNRQFQYERTQSRIGATLWQRQDLYLKNSPLFHATKINTPLLMTHNDKDGAVPWYQGIEFFTALRRLDKKVWLLQYNEEDHNLVERRNRKDLSIRLSQFFDHYLKGAPQPKWMKEGVPAIEKGIEWGLE